jgi:lipopolysaccharide transport system permease protein
MLMTAVLCVVFCPLFKADFREFAPFLLVGLAFWNFLVSTSCQGCQCFFQGEAYIRQQSAPLAIYPLRTVLGTSIHGLAALAVALVLTGITQGLHDLPALASLVPTLGLIFLLGWAVALCCGMTNVVFQDTQHLVEVLFQILFYLTPIMYPAKLLAERRIGWLMKFNPLAAFVELLRAPILDGHLPSSGAYLTALTTVVVLLGAATLVLSRFERRLIFYL